MKGPHRVLIVEDDPPMAEDIADLVRSLGCEPVTVDNKPDALAILSTQSFCFVLLDLSIKPTPDSLKGHETAGMTLLTAIREQYPERSGRKHRMPVLIISAHVHEAQLAVRAMRDGADDVIEKPLNYADVTDRIAQCLAQASRADHKECLALSPRATAPRSIMIEIPGDRDRQLTVVVVAGVPLKLTPAQLRNLLHLIADHLRERHTHKYDLGAQDHGFKGILRLRDALAPALGGADIIEMDGKGNYWFSKRVVVGACNTDALVGLDETITELAQRIRDLVSTGGAR